MKDPRADYYVYCWTNDWSGKQYVGKGRGNRAMHHKDKKHNKSFVTQAMALEGDDHFTLTYLSKGLTEEEAYTLEVQEIARRGCKFPFGYNRSSGGDGIRGADSGQAKLTEHDVLSIRQAYAEGATTTEIADLYPVNSSTISGIITGRYWGHVGGPLTDPATRHARHAAHMKGRTFSEEQRAKHSASIRRGGDNVNAKISDEQALTLRKRFVEGVPSKVLAKDYGIDSTLVAKIASGRAWKHLPPIESTLEAKLTQRRKRHKLTPRQAYNMRRLWDDSDIDIFTLRKVFKVGERLVRETLLGQRYREAGGPIFSSLRSHQPIGSS